MKVGRSVEITIFSGICWSADYEVGVSNNPSIGRLFGSQLENAWMMLQYYQFSGNDITDYLPFIEQAVIFYDENFRMREKARSGNVSALSLPTVWAGIGQSISDKKYPIDRHAQGLYRKIRWLVPKCYSLCTFGNDRNSKETHC